MLLLSQVQQGVQVAPRSENPHSTAARRRAPVLRHLRQNVSLKKDVESPREKSLYAAGSNGGWRPFNNASSADATDATLLTF